MSISFCPVCHKEEYDVLYPSYEGMTISSDLKIIENTVLDNRLCKGCGLIFNSKGLRGLSKNFYRHTYSLMMRKDEGEIKSYSSTGAMSQARKTYELFLEMSGVSPGTRLLEAGAGKGDFIGYLLNDYPDWPVEAFEPGESFKVLREKLPQEKATRCDYEAFSMQPETYDCIVTFGVLEHVENPYKFLLWINAGLKPKGICFHRVPLFENNPNDLFTVDHLSKLTTPTINYLARATGFEMINMHTQGVAAFFTLRKTENPEANLRGVYEDNKPIVEANCRFAKGAVDAVCAAREAALKDGSRFGIFGLATSGLFAPLLVGFSTREISAYIDENISMWGSEVHGRPVGGIDLISKFNIGHVALVISPVYHKKVKEKLKPFGVKVYTPE